MPIPDEITATIASDLGIAGLPIEEQRTIISGFGEIAFKAATLSVAEKLSEDKRNEFIQLTEAGDIVALKEFLDREVPGHEPIVKAAVAEEIKRFKEFQDQ